MPDPALAAWSDLVSKFGFGLVACYLIYFRVLPVLQGLCELAKDVAKYNDSNLAQNIKNGEHLHDLLSVVVGKRMMDDVVNIRSAPDAPEVTDHGKS
jgi:hypothetical protein